MSATAKNGQALSVAKELLTFIRNSPTAFQATDSIAALLEKNNFTRLHEGDKWDLTRGGKYYVTRNMTSIIAFTLPKDLHAFMMAAGHSDSPTFKLKENYETVTPNGYIRLDTEKYGGMIMSSWVDIPLSVAGRAVVRDGDRLVAKSVVVDKDLCLIPNVAIHFNRTINDGYKYNPAVDLVPLFSDGTGAGALQKEIAAAAGVKPGDVAGADLFLYNRMPGSIWGPKHEFYSAPRIDNLGCAFATLTGLLQADANDSAAQVYACFDNEEVGSSTKQGAASTFLRDVLTRICDCYGADVRALLSSSFLVSADNGHAKHPNHPELSDGQNAPMMNGGVVIKANAAQKYATDAVSAAVFTEICRRAGVPVQPFANRSDMAGGSTLGSISDTVVPVNTVDIGMAQLAMHSAYETAGTLDPAYMAQAMKVYYESRLDTDGETYFNVL